MELHRRKTEVAHHHAADSLGGCEGDGDGDEQSKRAPPTMRSPRRSVDGSRVRSGRRSKCTLHCGNARHDNIASDLATTRELRRPLRKPAAAGTKRARKRRATFL